ncbi:MAG: helix-turn-helix domain-containing protein [Deltaproteobacteria bacterium]
MQIGNRLRDMRMAKGLSQGDLEERTGLLRCYLSRVENGHTIPSLETLDRLANALGVEFYQIFYTGSAEPRPPKIVKEVPANPAERDLLDSYRRMNSSDQKLLLGLARYAARGSA